MSDPFGPVWPGDRPPNSARLWNRLREAARDNQRGGVETASPGPLDSELNPASHVFIKAGAEGLPVFSVSTYGSPLIAPATKTAGEVRRRPAFAAGVPASDTDEVCVTVAAAGPNGQVAAVSTGLAVCKLDVSDEDHTRAVPIAGETAKLASAKAGGYPVVFKEDGTGEVWAMVLLSGGNAGGNDANSDGTPYGSGAVAALCSGGRAMCVTFSGDAGSGRCSVVEAFTVPGVWSDESGDYAASEPVTTALGDGTYHFSLDADCKGALSLVFPGSSGSGADPVEYAYVGGGGGCMWFTTKDTRICTGPPGGPCVANVAFVSVCCRPCWDLDPFCNLPVTIFRLPAEVSAVGSAVYMGGCGNFGIYGLLDYSTCLAFNDDHTAIVLGIGTPGGAGGVSSYGDVQVISLLPFHAIGTFTDPFYGVLTFEYWQAQTRSTDTYFNNLYGPQPGVDCDACDGSAPYSWVANLCLASRQSDKFPVWQYVGSCRWEAYFPHESSSVVISGGTITLTTQEQAVYTGAIGESCCGEKVLTLTDTSGYEGGDPAQLPATVTIIPYGECGGTTFPEPPPSPPPPPPPPPPPGDCCTGGGQVMAAGAHPNLTGTGSWTLDGAFVYDTDMNAWFTTHSSAGTEWYFNCYLNLWRLAKFQYGAFVTSAAALTANCTTGVFTFNGPTFGETGTLTVSV